MNNDIKEIAEKFLTEEKISPKTALLMASLGLNKSAGDIADIAYGVNFSQHAYNDERRQQMVEFLGYAMLNWQILALSTGISADEIAKQFANEWITKRTGKASIKALLKHLKPNTRTTENSTENSTMNKPTNDAAVNNFFRQL
ncbi:MAG: hypothetical protein J5580_02440 [Clostridia bacterium]|nr:hypothetical protein [Clostridia bacterium]